MSVFIKKSGILTTVQDLGRNGFRRFGINQNGAMDKTAVRLVNALLANDENAAVLEMHYPAAVIDFEKPAFFALGGADFKAALDGQNIENWRIAHANRGSQLRFGAKTLGNRAYPAVRGGFKVERWLTSASTNLKARAGGFQGRKLADGDRIEFYSRADGRQAIANRQSPIAKSSISFSLIPFYSHFPTVRVVAGAEFELLSDESRDAFGRCNYKISPDSDRMGFRLTGEPLQLRHEKELVSSAVNFGTIQLLPDGQLIVLMADHQTTGGYPRLANVSSFDLPLVAQLGANDKIAFHRVSIAEAENLALDFENNLNRLKIAARFI